MLYKRKDEKELDPELFKAPTAEYRGFPFRAWNGKLYNGDTVGANVLFARSLALAPSPKIEFELSLID